MNRIDSVSMRKKSAAKNSKNPKKSNTIPNSPKNKTYPSSPIDRATPRQPKDIYFIWNGNVIDFQLAIFKTIIFFKLLFTIPMSMSMFRVYCMMLCGILAITVAADTIEMGDVQ